MKNPNPKKKSYMGAAPKVMPEDVMPATGNEAVDVHCALTIYRKLKEPITETKQINGLFINHEHTHVDHELTQFCARFKKWPVPESKVDQAIRDMGIALKAKMRENGIMR